MTKNFIYLASASPRRAELLRQIGVDFIVRPAKISERKIAAEAPAEYVERVAREKAAEVWRRVEACEEPRPVLSADTAVVVDGDVLGKPGNRERALAMLAQLSGRRHDVLTAVAVQRGHDVESSVNSSKVRFRATTIREREAYCGTDEPNDKAGGYAIQGFGAVFIRSLSGSFSSVMGLPLFETALILRRYGVPSWLCAEGNET
jgi:septum formation protein